MPTEMVQGSKDKSATPTRTRVNVAAEVTLLMRDDGTIPVAFNQGDYGLSGPNARDSRLAVDSAKGTPRSIQSSGCGMCSLVSYLAAAKLRCPTYDRSHATISMAAAVAMTPGSFNRYLLDRIDQEAKSPRHKKELTRKIYAPDGCGALLYRSPLLVTWIEELVKLNGDIKSITFHERIDAYAPPGHDIPDLTAHLDGGNPAILGVSFSPNAGPAHQVLVVGYARAGDKVYYPILDSGFGPMQIAALLKSKNPVSLNEVRKYCVSEYRPKPYYKIVWVMPLAGLATLTELKPRSDWAG